MIIPIMRLFSKARVIALAACALVAACMNDGPTELPSGPFYTITTSVANSTEFPVGSVVPVRASITHDSVVVFSAPVGFTVKDGGGTVSLASTTTDTLGHASVLWTLGDTAGVNTLIIATTDRADTVSVIAVLGEPAYVLAVGRDSTTAGVGVPVTLQVRVTDRTGNNVPQTPINWTATGGTLSAASAPTDPNGISQVTFSASAPGDYFVTAELPGKATHIYQVVVQ
jgi:hypothetical protein